MSEFDTPAHLISLLVQLRKALDDGYLPFAAADANAARAERAAVIKQLDDYIVPRLVQIDAPLLTVVGGSTGAGKSTLVNSLVGSRVTIPGVLRPTTRSPVLVHNVADAQWFGTDRLLPELVRTDHATHDQGTLQLVPTDRLPAGIAVLDAPDVDSVEERNRELAAELLAAADLWLFVTSAARYADQVPWDFLKSAAERSTAVAIVLDRTTPAAVQEVSAHLTRMLEARGLGESTLFTVPESVVDDEGLLPAEAVADIRGWLDDLASDATARSAVVRKTLDGALSALGHRVRTVSRALRTQEQIAAQLRNDVLAAYADGLDAFDHATGDGTLLRGEVLARWQDFVGAGEFMRSLEDKVGRLRDRLVSAARGRTQPVQRLTVAVESGLETLIVEHAESAAERAALAWRSLPAGAQLLATAPGDITRASRDFRARTEKAVREWQDDVLSLVRTEGAERRATARFLAYGVNSLGVVLMIAVFSQTAGLTGAEVGIAGGTAVLGQRILEAVFGDQAVRRLVDEARRDLHRRVEEDLLAPDRQRFLDLLEPRAVPVGAAQRILELSRDIESLRWEARSV
ncbi:MAG: hypothetical protein QOD35_1147 [Nocardioidaceae bacterium]|nr:hypothetical protein [Nocardioidaceae bacterium]